MPKSPHANWFAAQLKPNGLKRAEENLTRQGFETFCPKRLEGRLQGGQYRPRERPLFPGYLFVPFETGAQDWAAINATRGVSRLLLGNLRAPAPLPIHFIVSLMARCDNQGVIGARPDLKVGDTIRVVAGAFADTIAKIEAFQDGERLQPLLDLMGQEARVSVAQHAVEKPWRRRFLIIINRLSG